MLTKIMAVFSLMLCCGAMNAQTEGHELLGTQAPQLALSHWVNSAPLEITDLKGKVVLLRWWTDTCPLCAATAPALRKLQEEYGAKGLQVIGVFHPKPDTDWDMERVKRATKRFGFTFPVALDGDWAALKRWWLDGGERGATSVSFILDKHGVIRYIHPGGEFHEGKCVLPEDKSCEADYRAIEKTIGELLAEK